MFTANCTTLYNYAPDRVVTHLYTYVCAHGPLAYSLMWHDIYRLFRNLFNFKCCSHCVTNLNTTVLYIVMSSNC